MKKILFILFLLPLSVLAQQEDASAKREARKLVREGNELYNQEKFADAEVKYKKALQKDANSEIATYNLGNALFQQKRDKEAVAKYQLVAKTSKNKYTKASANHNIGNSFFQQKNYQKAVEAYKNSLRANPKDDETRYNLALAQKMLKNQQQQNKDNKDDKNKDNKDDKKDNKDKKDDKKDGDDKKDDKDKKDDDDKDKKNDKKEGDDKKDDKDKNGDNKDKKDDKQQQKPQQGKLSPQQVKQLLEAMNNEEQKTQKKMNAKKERGRKIKQEKDW